MWLNQEKISEGEISQYCKRLHTTAPQYIVIDNLFSESKLDSLMSILHQDHGWQTQQHTYSSLYVDEHKWQHTQPSQRFVKRDMWSRDVNAPTSIAHDFLQFLRGPEFMALLSRIGLVKVTDINVADPNFNTNYFRLAPSDFVNIHTDDSPARVLCMLLYLNQQWPQNSGGELMFRGKHDEFISIEPLYNRCVLFKPSSKGAEHWVKAMTAGNELKYRYNVTSWYWSE